MEPSTSGIGPTLRGLFADSAVYLVGSAMLALGGFLLVPLYTRRLTPAEFGIYALLDITVLIVVLVTQLKLDISYLRGFADVEAGSRGQLLGTVVLCGVTCAAAGGLALSLFTWARTGAAWLQTAEREFAWTLLPIVVLENVQGLLLSDLRARRRAVAFCSSTVVRLIGTVAATIWFMSHLHLTVYGVFLGRLVGDVAGVAVLAWACYSDLQFRFNYALLAPMLRFGLPLTWGGLMMLSLDASGRYFLSHMNTLEQVGYYGAAVKISGIFQMFITQPFAIAWGGIMFQVARWPNGKLIYSKILTYVSALALTVALAMAVVGPMLFSIFATPAYAPALTVFPLIVLIRAFGILEHPAAIGIFIAGRTKWFAMIYTVGLVANLAAGYLLVGRYSILGAAWAWLLGWLVVNGTMLYIGQRLYPLAFDWKLLALPSLLWFLLLVGPARWTDYTASLPWPAQALLALMLISGMSLLLLHDFRAQRDQVVWQHAGD